MRILMVCYELPPIGGGGGRVVDALSRELVKLSHQVDLVTMHFGGLPYFEQVEGVNIYRVPSIRFSKSVCHPPEMVTYMISALPTLLWLTLRNHYDINHTHFIFPDAVLSYALNKATGLPYIVTAHGSDVPGYNPNRFITLHKLLRPFWRKVVSGAVKIVSPSRSLARLIVSQTIGVPLTLIPNGLYAGEFDLSHKESNRILIVSRLFERKGIQYFLRSLEGDDGFYQVDIVGEGPYLPVLENIAGVIETNSNIHFHGWLDNDSPLLHQLLEQASIFVFPSESENFPLVLLEAMAAGLAIITTKGTGCEEVVGNTALLVKPKDSEAIQAALHTLVDQPELIWQLGNSARERVKQLFSWPVIASRYVETYQGIVHKSNP
jgi:glycosyltransferase involved in cell wall biosynthesis